MSLHNAYLKYCQSSANPNDLSLITFKFLIENFKSETTLFFHKSDPTPISVLKTNKSKNLSFWLEKLNNLNPVKSQHEDETYLYFFSDLDFLTKDIYFFVIDKLNPDIFEILSQWQNLYTILENAITSIEEKVSNTHSNLISQLLHDVQSLMDLSKSDNPELLKRIQYQKDINRNLLFYIRGFDLFKSDISILDFIRDSLIQINHDINNFNIMIETQQKINIDVELFSMAFNEIVNNALQVTENRYSDIFIKVNRINSQSPFTNISWFIISIRNKGDKITEDFLPYVTRPFFTTKKQAGHSGFGLANAQKIIQAHNGKLEIQSKDGTEIKIYIPQPLK